MLVRKTKRRRLSIVCWTVFALLLIVAGGCSRWSGGGPSLPSPVKEPAGDHDKRLKKKVGVVPFRIESIFGEAALKDFFQDNLLLALQKECPDTLFLKPADEDFPQGLADLPLLDSGAIDNFAVAMTGRRFGLNAVLVGKIVSINADEKARGFWFFRSSHYYVQVEILLALFDTETATKIYDKTLSRRMEVEEPDAELIRANNRIENHFVEPTLEEVIDDVKEDICSALERQAWKSYILAIDGADIQVGAGSRSGVQAGDIFTVYETPQAIEGYSGHRYLPTGARIGDIEVKTVSADASRATPLSGSGFKEGQVLRLSK
ncbi:MAG: hypothetical protein WAM73_15795 [Desulfobacterales bacterium]